ncbi:hypothetical protein NRF20_06460 [Streptomyces sp. R-74717]
MSTPAEVQPVLDGACELAQLDGQGHQPLRTVDMDEPGAGV